MARAIWSGSISFGLVNVPVKLFSAVSNKEVHFNMLHATDGARIKQKRVCSKDGKEVPYEEIVKGYELGSEKYVPISREELEKLDPAATRTIEIEEFVDLTEIDPIYFDHPYYVGPDKGAAKSYALLHAAMQESGKVALARMVLRTKQYLCALRPMGPGLVIYTMQYADEINDISELEGLPSANTKPKERELEMAKRLVESLEAKFKPEKYKDEYREKVLELIQKKAEGEEVVFEPAPKDDGKVINLMDALERSLASVASGELRHRAQAAKTARKPAAKKATKKKSPARKRKSA